MDRCRYVTWSFAAALSMSLLGCPGDLDSRHDTLVLRDLATASNDDLPALSFSDGGTCPSISELEGTYSGTWEGESLSGTLGFSLHSAGSDEFLTIEVGKMTGEISDLSTTITADLSGTVTCGHLSAEMKILEPALGLAGKLSGAWSGSGFSNGSWGLGNSLGSGSWQVQRSE